MLGGWREGSMGCRGLDAKEPAIIWRLVDISLETNSCSFITLNFFLSMSTSCMDWVDPYDSRRPGSVFFVCFFCL